jgi:hypothetical protein
MGETNASGVKENEQTENITAEARTRGRSKKGKPDHERLAKALRENLRRRKAQAQARQKTS